MDTLNEWKGPEETQQCRTAIIDFIESESSQFSIEAIAVALIQVSGVMAFEHHADNPMRAKNSIMTVASLIADKYYRDYTQPHGSLH